MRPAFGDWRSLVAHFVRDEGVGGSNPLSPTKFEKPAQRAGFFAFEAHEDENLRGRGGSTRAKRENVAPATARRASHEVASNPLSPTKFEKPAQRAGFFASAASEDENLRGQEVRLERSERTLRQQRPAGRATKWRVILYHRPNSKSLLNEQAFLHLRPVRMRTSGGRRFDSSEARERCVSNGPQGEPQSGESSSITDQIRKACSMSRLFCFYGQ